VSTPLPSDALGAVPALIAAARALEAAGRDIVRLDIGEPAFPTPPHIIEAGVRALRDGQTKYVAPQGLLPLREAIADAERARAVDADADRIVVTSGAKPMLVFAMLALLTEGDEVLVPDPGYPGYSAAVALAGGRAVPYPSTESADGYRLDLAALRARISPRTRAIVVNTPSNPTGAVLDAAELSALAELAVEYDLRIVSDEVYSAISFGDVPPPSIASCPGMAERTILVNSFSKTYAMTGWRLGYGVVPRSLVRPIVALVNDCSTCAPPFVQHAGVAALRGPQSEVAWMRAEYQARRDALGAGLDGLDGIRGPRAAGAFYAFPDVAALLPGGEGQDPWSSADLAGVLLHEYGVACLPGSAFGRESAARLRLSFASPADRITEGVARLARCVSDRLTGRGQDARATPQATRAPELPAGSVL
jgi:aspartate/methionine/tyrosine aminotransferase